MVAIVTAGYLDQHAKLEKGQSVRCAADRL